MSGLNTFTKDELEDLRLAASAKKCSMPGAMLRKLLDSYERLLAHTGADNEMSERLICRFCDKSNWRILFDASTHAQQVECASCLARGPLADSQDNAVAAWNRRAPSAEHLVTARGLYFDPEDAARLDYETAGEPTTGAEQQQQEPVAWRYKDARGHWRYVGAPLTEGWVFHGLLDEQPLYTHRQPQAQGEPIDLDEIALQCAGQIIDVMLVTLTHYGQLKEKIRCAVRDALQKVHRPRAAAPDGSLPGKVVEMLIKKRVLDDALSWADGILGDVGTEFAGRITEDELMAATALMQFCNDMQKRLGKKLAAAPAQAGEGE